MSARVLVVDDDRAVRTALEVNLTKRGDRVTVVDRAEAALRALREHAYDVLITDVRMPGASGLELLERVRATWPDVAVVVMTGFGSVADAVGAIKAGAAEYLIKPIGKEELYLLVDRALERRTLRAELVQLRREVQERYGMGQLIGTTPAMLALYEEVSAVADSQATVLLQGPTGTGKELLAHALHYRSRRSSGPFVRVNCAAIPATLLESELFGHERGAFTGAVREHQGRFEQADGGTLFLDEVGEIELAMQPKLLRALESGEVQRLGGRETIKVDVRVVAATNRDLHAEVAAGRFREDLFYRLHVVALRVPPLRERLDDVPLLVEHFVRVTALREHRPVPRVDRATMERLSTYAWPGNVRQLQHVVERALLLSRPDVDALDIPVPDDHATAPAVAAVPAGLPDLVRTPGLGLTDALEEVERALIVEALRAAGGVQAQAARQLGLSKSNLNYRIKRLGLSLKDLAYG